MLRSANSNCITITCKKLITRCIMYKVEINGVYEYFMYQSIYGLYETVICTYKSKLEVYLREVYWYLTWIRKLEGVLREERWKHA